MTNHEIIALEQSAMMQTYGRLPIAVDHGKGATWYDADGKQYIDFTSGIGVNALGLCDEDWIAAVTEQLHRAQHVCNYYYTESSAKLAAKLTALSGLSRVFLANSGAEANEGAIKVARKYSYDKYGEGRGTILTLRSSFHGRTMNTLMATGQDKFHQWFYPFPTGFAYVEAGSAEALEAAYTPDICAVMAEPVMGEGGVYPLEPSYLEALRKFCDARDLLLILDEVQCGIGRTGKMFAYQHSGILPDVLTLAKGLGGGLPIGAFLCGEKCADTLGKGQHGSTFGGNPIAAAGALVVLDKLTAPRFLDEVTRKGELIRETVLSAAPRAVKGVRGKGLMLGFQVEGTPADYLKAAAEAGLLVLTAGADTIRLLPPLNITDEEIQAGAEILIAVLNQ
ncbi:MAG: aspartate aminotransferase family protein [Clostridia bacterium]|nr:aspartate aminotransferase family protein [Clostridia bacterium]